MGRSRSDAGFTLIELLVVVGMLVVVIATLGVFFLGGPTPAVASATRDINAAFGEARETATAFSEATVVFTPAGTGYSARVYREMPGNGAFQVVNGPTYDSTVSIAETAAPLGTPGFAFRVDSRGSVTGYQHYTPGDTTFTMRTCPPSGAFTLALAYANQKQTVTIPCTLSLSSVTIGATVTPAPSATTTPYAAGTCPPSESCVVALAAFNATCPPGYTPDGTQPNVCDSPTPAPIPTATSAPSSVVAPPSCPSGYGGTYPNCSANAAPTAQPHVIQMYTGLWSETVCNDPYCDSGTIQIEYSAAYSLMSNGDVFTTRGGPQPLIQFCPFTNQVYPQADKDPTNDAPYDPGIWIDSAVSQNGSLYTFDLGFNNIFEGNSGDPSGLYIAPNLQYQYSNVGTNFDFFKNLNDSVPSTGTTFLLVNCNQP
jgi:prepilin-type N-terminal cleavage/methylation domain-containing protein